MSPKNGFPVLNASNGAVLYNAIHHDLSVSGVADAFSSVWGGVLRGPDHVTFEAAVDSPDEWIEAHTNEKAAYALHKTIKLFTEARKSGDK